MRQDLQDQLEAKITAVRQQLYPVRVDINEIRHQGERNEVMVAYNATWEALESLQRAIKRN